MRKFLYLVLLMAVCFVFVGCQGEKPFFLKDTWFDMDRNAHRLSVIGTDFRLIQRDADVIFGLNRNMFNEVYESPSYIDGH